MAKLFVLIRQLTVRKAFRIGNRMKIQVHLRFKIFVYFPGVYNQVCWGRKSSCEEGIARGEEYNVDERERGICSIVLRLLVRISSGGEGKGTFKLKGTLSTPVIFSTLLGCTWRRGAGWRRSSCTSTSGSTRSRRPSLKSRRCRSP